MINYTWHILLVALVGARRNSHDVKGPVVIEIWADSKTGMPHRIVFHDAKFQGSTQPRRLTFDLISEAPLPADWFTPSVHVPGMIGGGPPPRGTPQ